ncbi:hypothetical protein EV360DRAFT_84652 [Lentinula raphanica]|nr:hypothetical protein EV360DRAFT_84652 [Lentinula raphanica]
MPKVSISRSRLDKARDATWQPSSRLHRSTESASTRAYALRNRNPLTIATDAGEAGGGDHESNTNSAPAPPPQNDERFENHESNTNSALATPPQNDERFENFVAVLKSMHGCGVCRDILSSPYTLTDCGHTFCASCLNGVIDSNKRMRIGFKHYYTCPECRAAINSMPLQSFAVGHTVDALREVLGLAHPSAEQLSFAANDIRALPTSLPRLRPTGPPRRRLAPFPLSP